MKSLSLIILTYNSEKHIYNCLKSVYQYNDIGDGLEIIIVDNNSINYAEMRDNIRLSYPDVKIIANDKNGGYGQGNNVGIRAATAPVVCIMNPDVRLIMPVFKLFIKTLTDDTIMCGGKQYIYHNKPAISFSYDHHAFSIMQSVGILLRRKYDKYAHQHMWLSGAFFAIKKQEFEQLGLFDERIFMYGEEYDIHLRIRKNMREKKIKYLPQSKYLHLIEDREITESHIIKQLQSDLLVCQFHNIPKKLCIRRKIIAHYISFFISRIYCALRGINLDTSSHELTLNVLKDIYHNL